MRSTGLCLPAAAAAAAAAVAAAAARFFSIAVTFCIAFSSSDPSAAAAAAARLISIAVTFCIDFSSSDPSAFSRSTIDIAGLPLVANIFVALANPFCCGLASAVDSVLLVTAGSLFFFQDFFFLLTFVGFWNTFTT
uniref:Uncharacterized protein n=1 Tax=Anopheles darlingi TaxID=43151 RepID=A0A2M4DBH5_ANODA